MTMMRPVKWIWQRPNVSQRPPIVKPVRRSKAHPMPSRPMWQPVRSHCNNPIEILENFFLSFIVPTTETPLLFMTMKLDKNYYDDEEDDDKGFVSLPPPPFLPLDDDDNDDTNHRIVEKELAAVVDKE